ncbi:MULTISPECIES: YqeG family HAD IIIA-type phosphatase [Geomicrobium]|uniref:HAD superfamily phosphatase (TIGR01668 family) n=1 Tax=Geomicrobium sediminis TaxID=1347788 RepID=A0ABS2PFE5_9BACL|nr:MULTISPECIES: YqeG family HAD IIIA-type phosphatase [Geomicrobium]MBM7633790.1 HAD superfamily phosphatase (TIGR01668 family) [Geomicrobium sediminis]GAK06402.1 hydrolase [Geomicrobium sp. JCM 19038]
MLGFMVPDQFAESIYDIDFEELKQQGIKGVITDLDNTLVEWDRADATPELLEWIEMVQSEGFKITIVSNNKKKRVGTFSEPTGVSWIHSAKKPLTRAFRRATKEMNLTKDQVVVVGDQLLTDVFGGNRGGYHTILVVPVSKTDGWFTKANRRVERMVMKRLEKHKE